jgi:hypothetical protein
VAHRENFTVERMASYACPAGKQQAFFWDAKVSGFGLRANNGPRFTPSTGQPPSIGIGGRFASDSAPIQAEPALSGIDKVTNNLPHCAEFLHLQ